MNSPASGRMAAPLTIIGVVFSIMGGIFLTLGVVLNLLLFEESLVFLLAFGGIGLVFLLIGLGFLLTTARKLRRQERLIADGNYVRAEVMEATPCYNINVNGRSPYILTCRHTDLSGVVHIFKSDYLNFDPTGLLISNSVMVYVDKNDYSRYYVDLQSALPKVEIH